MILTEPDFIRCRYEQWHRTRNKELWM